MEACKSELRSKYLIKNTAIFAIGNISTKFIHFFLVPLYTYVLSTEEYGTVDLMTSICSMLIPLMMCNIGEAIRRYMLDKNPDSRKIRAIAYSWNFIGLLVSIIMYVVLSQIPSVKEYALLISAYAFSNALLQTTQDYLRGKEKLAMYTVCSVFSALSAALLNILFLMSFHWGIKGYFLAYVISYFATALISFIAGAQYKKLSKLKLDIALLKEMSLFSITLVPNSIMWWITNSSDRLMVTYMVSAAANGIYSVSYKLPSLLTTFNMILMQAWQYSAIKESDSTDKVAYNNQMFRFYFASTAIIAAGLLFILKPFMGLYVSPAYYEAWRCSPFLIIGLMFQTLGTFVGTSYYVVKDMKGNLISSTVGAVINVVLNFLLIPFMGAQGASIATCISYIVIFIYRLWDTKKYLPIYAMSRFTLRITVVLLGILIAVYLPGASSYILMGLGCILVLWLTRSFYMGMIKRALRRGK